MSKKYVDVKCTVWVRHQLSDDANTAQIIEDLKSGVPVEEAIEEFFEEAETLHDTMVEYDPKDNLIGLPTVEVYDETKEEFDALYTNARSTLEPF